MLIRREVSRSLRTSPLTSRSPRSNCSAIGTMIWLETIVDTAIAATMTIDVADENPPRKASSASSSRPNDSGRVSTNRSGLEPAGRYLSPAIAIGMTNRHMPNR